MASKGAAPAHSPPRSPLTPPDMANLKPLPDCEGPKLEPFTHDLMAMDFEFLDMHPKVSDGVDSMIVKVKIDGKVYCLKIFFNEESSVLGPWSPWNDHLEKQSDEVKKLVRLHTTPFYNECRAFGRLKELGLEHLAVKVHGYAELYACEKLTKTGQAWMEKNQPRCLESGGPFDSAAWLNFDYGSIPGLNLGPEDAERKKKPVMCIVKDWVQSPYQRPGLRDTDAARRACEQNNREVLRDEIRRIPRLLEELHQLHKCGIVNRDLHLEQYVDGVLVDLSRAWTIPHILGPDGGVWPSWSFASMAAGDLWRFQTYVVDECNERSAGENAGEGLKGADRLLKSRVRAYPKPAGGGVIARLRHLPHREGQSLSYDLEIANREDPMPLWGYGRLGVDVQGPLFPLLESDAEPERSFIHWPRHDPALFDWKAVGSTKPDDDAAAATPADKTRRKNLATSDRVNKRPRRSR